MQKQEPIFLKSSCLKVLSCVFILSYIYCWIYVEEFDWFFHIWEDKGLIPGIVICVLSFYLLILFSGLYLKYYLLGQRLGLSAQEYYEWKQKRQNKKKADKQQIRINRRTAIERGERSEFEFFSNPKNTSSSTVKEDSSSNHDRIWVIVWVVIFIAGLISLYFDATEGTRHSSEPSYYENEYHPSFKGTYNDRYKGKKCSHNKSNGNYCDCSGFVSKHWDPATCAICGHPASEHTR